LGQVCTKTKLRVNRKNAKKRKVFNFKSRLHYEAHLRYYYEYIKFEVAGKPQFSQKRNVVKLQITIFINKISPKNTKRFEFFAQVYSKRFKFTANINSKRFNS